MLDYYIYTLFFMSIITFCAFLADKKKAQKEKSRVPEAALLSLAALGGGYGAFCGMYLLRHKTIFITKFHFAITVWISVIVETALIFYILWVSV